MRELYHIIQKNFKILFRSKASALVVVFAPMLIIFLVGLAFDNANTYKVNMGVYSDKYNELTDSFVGSLEDEFNVVRSDSENDCINEVKSGNLHICLVFSPDFRLNQSDIKNEITYHVDYSKINLVWMILDTVSAKMQMRSSELSMDLTEMLLTKLDETQSEIRGQKPVLIDFTTQNNDIANAINEIDQSINELNLEMDLSGTDVASFKTSGAIVSELASNVVKHSLDMIKSIEGPVGSLAASTNSSDTQNSVSTILSQTKAKIENINVRLANNSAILSSTVEEIDTNLGLISEKMSQANTARDGINEKIIVVQQSVVKSLNNIIQIQNSLNRIDTSIESIKVRDSTNIVNPITTTMKPVITQRTHLNYMFPSLLILIVMFTSIMLASTMVLMEKNSRAYFRNFVTPAKDYFFVLGIFLTNMILMFGQLIIILFIAGLFFTTQILGNLPYTLVILLLITTLFTLIGMIVGYFFKSETTSTLASISVGSVFLFLSDVILPIEGMPYYMIKISKMNPFVVSETLIKKSILFYYSISGFVPEIYYIIIYIIIAFVVLLVTQGIMKKDYIAKYVKKLAPIKEGVEKKLNKDATKEIIKSKIISKEKKVIGIIEKFKKQVKTKPKVRENKKIKKKNKKKIKKKKK